MRQGPHHVAQKSTTASPSCFSISTSKSLSVTSTAFDIYRFLAGMARMPVTNLFCAFFPTRNLMPQSTGEGARIAHIGIAVRSITDALPFYRDVLGMDPADLATMDGARISGLDAGGPLIELLKAVDDDSPIGKFVRSEERRVGKEGRARWGTE